MNKPTLHDTFSIERIYDKTPSQVFHAFGDPEKRKQWLGAGTHHTVEQFDTDFRVDGTETLRCRFGEGTPFPGVELCYFNQFLNLIEDERVVMSSRMSFAGNLVSISQETFELFEVGDQTRLVFTNQTAYFEGSDGPEIRKHGWGVVLDRLTEALA